MALPAALLMPLVGGIVDAGKAWIKKKFPDPEEQARREREWEETVASMDHQAIESFRNFVVAYEGAAADVHPSIQILRGVIRPLLTLYLVGLLTWAIVDNQSMEVLHFIWVMNLLSLGFWFGERALNNLGINGDTIRAIKKGGQ